MRLSALPVLSALKIDCAKLFASFASALKIDCGETLCGLGVFAVKAFFARSSVLSVVNFALFASLR
jgi:hypothetical protein